MLIIDLWFHAIAIIQLEIFNSAFPVQHLQQIVRRLRLLCFTPKLEVIQKVHSLRKGEEGHWKVNKNEEGWRVS